MGHAKASSKKLLMLHGTKTSQNKKHGHYTINLVAIVEIILMAGH